MGTMNDDKTAPGAGPAPREPEAASQPSPVRVITQAEELKAMSDPTRLAILVTLTRSRSGDLPVMSVKELAQALGEPQTKLYRHVRQLESVGLIRVASSRMVSGILEQRYQAAQRDVLLAPLSLRENTDEALAVAQAVLDRFTDGFFASYMAAGPGSPGWQEGDWKASMMAGAAKLSPARAAEVRTKLAEVLAWFDEPDSDDPDAEEMNLLIGYYRPTGVQAG
jgi:DNA-binding transcriptional ArsR family regulator